MRATYDEALRRLLVHEGGYTNDAADPGGPTNWGITIFDVRKYINPKATAADVRALTLSQAKTIYAERYANPIRYDELPPGVDYAVFDYGVNSGISRSAKVLQRIVGVPADGEIGPATIAAVRARHPAELVEAICAERLRFLQGLRTWRIFGKGWGRRVSEVRAAALVMAKADVLPAPHPTPSPGKGQEPKPTIAKDVGIVGGLGAFITAIAHFAGAHPAVTVTIAVAAVTVVLVMLARRG